MNRVFRRRSSTEATFGAAQDHILSASFRGCRAVIGRARMGTGGCADVRVGAHMGVGVRSALGARLNFWLLHDDLYSTPGPADLQDGRAYMSVALSQGDAPISVRCPALP
jgi:hypothetical protein